MAEMDFELKTVISKASAFNYFALLSSWSSFNLTIHLSINPSILKFIEHPTL
jgi:hypothetical protein